MNGKQRCNQVPIKVLQKKVNRWFNTSYSLLLEKIKVGEK